MTAPSRSPRDGFIADYNDATNFLALVRCDSDQNNNFNCNRKAEELINQGTQQSDDAGQAQAAADAGHEDDHGRLSDRSAAAVFAAALGKSVRRRILAGERAGPFPQQGPVHHQALNLLVPLPLAEDGSEHGSRSP